MANSRTATLAVRELARVGSITPPRFTSRLAGSMKATVIRAVRGDLREPRPRRYDFLWLLSQYPEGRRSPRAPARVVKRALDAPNHATRVALALGCDEPGAPPSPGESAAPAHQRPATVTPPPPPPATPTVEIDAPRHTLAVGSSFSCALRRGQVYCWGDNREGAVGVPAGEEPRTRPSLVPELRGVVSLAASRFHAAALHEDGTVSCWGDNHRGWVGDGLDGPRPAPHRLPDVERATDLWPTGAGFCATATSTPASRPTAPCSTSASTCGTTNRSQRDR